MVVNDVVGPSGTARDVLARCCDVNVPSVVAGILGVGTVNVDDSRWSHRPQRNRQADDMYR